MRGLIYFRNDAGILRNISDLTGVPEDEVDRFVDGLKFKNSGGNPHLDYWGKFQDQFGVNPEILGTVYFHGCRCIRSNKFELGLLPNNQALEIIWQQVWSICGDLIGDPSAAAMRIRFEREAFSRRSGGYFDRISGPARQFGPWGKLVRAEWFLESTGSDHYLKNAPEIISEILNYFSPDGAMYDLYRKATAACIVHFKTDLQDASRIGHGLLYLRDKRHCAHYAEYTAHYGLDSMCGVAVPPENILKIEYLD